MPTIGTIPEWQRRLYRTKALGYGFENPPAIDPGTASASITHKGPFWPSMGPERARFAALDKYEQLRSLGYAPTPGMAFDPGRGTVGGISSRPIQPIVLGGGRAGGRGTPAYRGGGMGGGKGWPGGMALSGPASSERETDLRRGEGPQGLPLRSRTGGVIYGGGGGGWSGAGPDPYAQGDYGAELATLGSVPQQILDQYGAVANLGVFGPAGMKRIRELGIDPAKERLETMPGDIMGLVRAAEAQGRTAAATAMGKRFGGRFAGQPGRAATAIMETIVGPSLAREARMAAGLTESQIEKLNTLDLMSASLEERNQMSKAAIGLPGMQSALGQIDALLTRRYKDTSMENKFGWAPERRGAVESMLQKQRAAWGIEAQKQAAYWNAYYQAELMRLQKELEGSGFGWDDLLDIGIDIASLIYGGGTGGAAAGADGRTAGWD